MTGIESASRDGEPNLLVFHSSVPTQLVDSHIIDFGRSQESRNEKAIITLMSPPSEHSKGSPPEGGPPLRSNSGLPTLDLTTTAQEILRSARSRNAVPQQAAAGACNQTGVNTTDTTPRQTRLLDVLQAASEVLNEESEAELSRWSETLMGLDDPQQEDDNNIHEDDNNNHEDDNNNHNDADDHDNDGGSGHSSCTGDGPHTELP
jgi:hypothetical protein